MLNFVSAYLSLEVYPFSFGLDFSKIAGTDLAEMGLTMLIFEDKEEKKPLSENLLALWSIPAQSVNKKLFLPKLVNDNGYYHDISLGS